MRVTAPGLTSAQVASLALADTAAQKASNLSDLANAGTARTNLALGTMATQAASAVAITGGTVAGITDLAIADGGTGDSVGGPFALGSEVWEVRAPVAGQNYSVVGFPSLCGFTRASSAPVTRGRHLYAPSVAALAVDGFDLAGFNSEANNRLFFCASTSVWTQYLFLGTNASTAIRGGGGMANGNATDVDKIANNSVGIRLRPSVSAAVHAYSTDNAGATTASTLGLTLATNTIYVFKIAWNGTSLNVSYATINHATGVWSAFSTPVNIATNLPTSTLGLAPMTKWWNHGAVQPTLDVGGCQVVPWLVVSP